MQPFQIVRSPLQTFHLCLYHHSIPIELRQIIQSSLFAFFDNHTLRRAVNRWCDNPDSVLPQYGHISDWNTSNVTNISMLFYNKHDFNDDISQWDVSNVTDMNELFTGAHNTFNQPLDSWDVRKVSNMSCMFMDAYMFNQPLNSWNVSNVKNMIGMFHCACSFNR